MTIVIDSNRTARVICCPDVIAYIYLFDIATKNSTGLTKSKWDESAPHGHSDGTRIAFMSNHADDPTRFRGTALRRRSQTRLDGSN